MNPGADLDIFSAYRRMFACPDDQMVCWWYVGSCFAEVPGWPELLVTAAETVMVYRLQTVSADCFRIRWWEIGYFRDPMTGEIAEGRFNPVTGRQITTPTSFEEGPATITVSRASEGVALEIEQPHALVRSATVTWKLDGDRVFFNQEERKVRGLPRADGSLPDASSADTAEGITNLSIFASRTAIEASENVMPCAGVYTFELDRPSPWMGFDGTAGRTIVRGQMAKAALDVPLNPIAWQRLKSLLPHAFDDDRLKPRWL
jgi:hypothetical protein